MDSTMADEAAERQAAVERAIGDRAQSVRILVVSRIHVSRMGAEIWKVTEGSAPYTGEGEFESGDKDAILNCVASSVADAKFIQDPHTHRLIPWPENATRDMLCQWLERPHGPMHGDVVADWRPETDPAT
ncbi:hypothetical protein [Actinopolymorpha rutila]|uniref:Uncharacterized protein n=1 Tax=Actinopolymorpha rutila TaxID=446787 RepID=A0A852Z5W5_9ACTN|nr:hypothetical protein [Actinopolymorpha rutila]NYH88374.1 hypothetical protein [Actinopolymorpha rutila]